MNRLRLLQLNSVNLFGSYKHFSKKLQWLCWREFPLESIPADLYLGNVVAIDMRYGSFKQVWEEETFLRKLKFLNLSHSHELTETPNFEGLPNLETLILKDCSILVGIHESIGLLTKLVTLNLKDCTNLENLPRSICVLRSLENLNISGCSKLDMLPEELGNMRSLVVFAANGTAISQVPESVAELKNLISLFLSQCQLKPSPIKGPNFIGFLPVSLRGLDLSYCNLSDDMIPNYLQNLPSLDGLDISGNSFSSLPPTITLLPKLSYLCLNDCRRLQSVPELPSTLMVLLARYCTELERINLTNSNSLSVLELGSCDNLVEIGGSFKVEPVRVNLVKKPLETHGLSQEKYLAKIHLCMMNNLTHTYMISPLQGLSEDGIYSIFLPRSEIPSCYNQSKGDSITFNVPLLQSCKILGFIIFAVYARNEFFETSSLSPWIRILNETKMLQWTYYPIVSFLNEAQEADSMWLSNWRFKNSRFKNEMEEGDTVKVSIRMGARIPVKKCGVHLLYQQNDRVDSEMERVLLGLRCLIGIESCHMSLYSVPISYSFIAKQNKQNVEEKKTKMINSFFWLT